MALETFSPAELMCFRYLTSGTLLLAIAWLRGAHLPRGRELWITAACGAVTLGIGNACLAFAEEWVSSGLAALFVTTSPFWLVGVEALAPRGERLQWPVIRGMLAGAVGIAVLVGPEIGRFSANRAAVGAFLLLQFGCASWAAGSIAQRKTPARAHPFVSAAVQQLATGVLYSVPVMIHADPIHWSKRGIGALIYLMIFGSIVGYSAYVYAMNRLPVAVASIYTYVNPIIAVLLGWLVFHERFGAHEGIAMLMIFAGVAIVKRAATSRVTRANQSRSASPVEQFGADGAAEGGQYGE